MWSSKFVKMHGGNLELGSKLASMFKEINNNEAIIDSFQPIITEARLKRAVLLSAKSCGPQYIASGLATDEEVKRIIENIQKEVVDNNDSKLVQCEMIQAATIRNK